MTTATSSHVHSIIVGGGPAGVVLALLLAGQGLDVLLLEAHNDFEREFRGDTVHPSTLALLEQLGLLERLYELPHARIFDFPTHYPDGTVSEPRASRLGGRFPDSIQVQQARFLDMLVDEARRYPTFHLQMGARVEQLVEEDGVVRGVRYRAADGIHEVRSTLVVGADGRFSRVRQLAGLELITTSEPLDVLWFYLPYGDADPERAHGLYVGAEGLLVMMDRGDKWQVGYVYPKGGYQQLRAVGLEALRKATAERIPWLADRVDLLQDWRQTSVLSFEAGRLQTWYKPGLLMIGDAAHVMSPVGGVGINYAIQDAVVASNVLGPKLLSGDVRMSDLAKVQRKRELPTRLMQALQQKMRPQVVSGGKAVSKQPLTARMFLSLAPVQEVLRRLMAFGGWAPERMREVPAQSRSQIIWDALARVQPGFMAFGIGWYPPTWPYHES